MNFLAALLHTRQNYTPKLKIFKTRSPIDTTTALVCIFPSIMIRQPSKESNNYGIRAPNKRAFKNYYFFVTQKSNKQAQMLRIKFSSTPNTGVQQVLQPLFSKPMPLILFPPLVQPLGQNQQNGEQP